MTEKILVKDLQKQDPGSAVVDLYEFEYAKNTWAYFAVGLEADLSTIQMRDYSNNSQINTYVAAPVQAKGFEHQASGTYPNPSFTIANATSVFSGAVGTTDYDSLVGNRVIRRTTLKKYLYGEASATNPPTEYPRQVFYIDRIKTRTKISVEFSLRVPFELEGIKIPYRQVVVNRCPWEYQGASDHLSEYQKAKSGCTWRIDSTYEARHLYTENGATTYKVYVNQDDEYIVPSSLTFGNWTSESGANTLSLDTYWYTQTTASRAAANGTVSSQTVNNYWQVATQGTKTALGTPTDTNENFKRVRTYATYSHGTEYFIYSDDKKNDYVTFTDNVASSATYNKTLMWKAKKASINVAPTYSTYWERGDICGKSLTSCGMRFGFTPINTGNTSTTGKTEFSTNVVIPFGGFPAAKDFG
jgi:lambda family phage minor tail protein L